MVTLTIGLAMLVGAALVLLGAGGSIVTVPILLYAAGLDVHHAAGTSLLVVGLVAAAGAWARRRGVRPRTGLLFGLAGMVGTIPGAWLNHHVPDTAVVLAFGATTLIAAARMTRQIGSPGSRRHHVQPGLALGTGAGVGMATGFFGVGGGFLVVPALVVLLGLEPPAAVATSLLVIALNCAAGLVAHGGYGAVEWRLGLGFTVAALAGAALALPIAPRLSAGATQRAFALMLATVGFGMLWSGIGRLVA